MWRWICVQTARRLTTPCSLVDRGKPVAVFIPPGFAHGFATLEDDTVFHYLCTNLYHPESECALLWNDPDLGIDWGMDAPLVSEKDAQAKAFATFESPFVR